MEIIKRIILCGLILTLIGVLCTRFKINSTYFSHIQKYDKLYTNVSKNPYPMQNFLYLDDVLLGEDKTGLQKGETIGSASGTALNNKGDKVFALTAGHWCEIGEEDYSKMINVYQVLAPDIQFSIKKRAAFFGEFYPIDIIYLDTVNDICVITFESPYAHKIKKIKPAKNYPKLGEEVFTSSAPLGIFSHDMRLFFDGYFSGCDTKANYCFYTIPGIHGSSGSGVLDKHGNIVSILNIAIKEFNNITGGVRLEVIKQVYDDYIR